MFQLLIFQKHGQHLFQKQKNKNPEHKKRRSVSDDEDRKLKQTKENKLDQKRTENALSTKAVQDATPGPSTTLTEVIKFGWQALRCAKENECSLLHLMRVWLQFALPQLLSKLEEAHTCRPFCFFFSDKMAYIVQMNITSTQMRR